MKILLANKFFHLKGGSERVLFQERQALLDQGHEVVDFSMRHPDNLASPHASHFLEPIDYHAPASPARRLALMAAFISSPEALRRLKSLVLATRPDIAHLHNIYHQITPAIIPLLRGLGVKVVLTLHDGKVVCPSYIMLRDGKPCTRCGGTDFRHAFLGRCGGGLAKSLLLSAEACWHGFRGSYARVDAIVSPSRFLADLAEKRPDLAGKVTVIPNGVDTDALSPCFEDDGYALYLGRLSAEKGIRTLLLAHAALPGQVRLKIAGAGPVMDELRAEFPLAEFLGHQSGEELVRLVQRASFVVAPSEWYENCPMSVLEAMALGKPVIGAAIGGIPELVDHGRTGLLFPAGDAQALGAAMQRLWAETGLRDKMGRAARQRAEDGYSARLHCQRLLELFEGLLR